MDDIQEFMLTAIDVAADPARTSKEKLQSVYDKWRLNQVNLLDKYLAPITKYCEEKSTPIQEIPKNLKEYIKFQEEYKPKSQIYTSYPIETIPLGLHLPEIWPMDCSEPSRGSVPPGPEQPIDFTEELSLRDLPEA